MFLDYVNSTAHRRALVNTVISLRIPQRRGIVWVAEWLLDSPEQVCSIENVICLLGYVVCYLISRKASYFHFEYCSHSLKSTQCSSQPHKRRSSTIRPALLRGQLIGPLPWNPSFSQPSIHSVSSPTKRSWVPSYWKTIAYYFFALKSSIGGKENSSNISRQTFPLMEFSEERERSISRLYGNPHHTSPFGVSLSYSEYLFYCYTPRFCNNTVTVNMAITVKRNVFCLIVKQILTWSRRVWIERKITFLNL